MSKMREEALAILVSFYCHQHQGLRL